MYCAGHRNLFSYRLWFSNSGLNIIYCEVWYISQAKLSFIDHITIYSHTVLYFILNIRDVSYLQGINNNTRVMNIHIIVSVLLSPQLQPILHQYNHVISVGLGHWCSGLSR